MKRVQKCPSIRVALAFFVALPGALPLLQICISEHHENHVFLAGLGCPDTPVSHETQRLPESDHGPGIGLPDGCAENDCCIDLALSRDADSSRGASSSAVVPPRPAVVLYALFPAFGSPDLRVSGPPPKLQLGRSATLLSPIDSGNRLLI